MNPRVATTSALKGRNLGRMAALGLAVLSFIGCASGDGGGTVSGSTYYGTGFNDPWYHGGYYYPPGVVVTPPPGRPPPRPAHPIAPPPRPMPRAR